MSNSEHDATGKMPEPAGEVELRDAEIAEISGGATGGLYPEKTIGRISWSGACDAVTAVRAT